MTAELTAEPSISVALDDIAASVEYETVGEMTYSILREAILSGVLPDGMKLRQEPLAAAIGVSRIPVRSALKQLETDGLVVFSPRRGARVRSVTVDRVGHVFDARIVLECHALRCSMDSMTAERAGRLAELATRLDQGGLDGDFRVDLLDFYHQLYDRAGRPVLADLIDQLRDNVGRQLVAQPIHHQDDTTHRALVSPVISGDVEVAVQRLTEHLTAVKDAIIANIVRSGAPTNTPSESE